MLLEKEHSQASCCVRKISIGIIGCFFKIWPCVKIHNTCEINKYTWNKNWNRAKNIYTAWKGVNHKIEKIWKTKEVTEVQTAKIRNFILYIQWYFYWLRFFSIWDFIWMENLLYGAMMECHSTWIHLRITEDISEKFCTPCL